LGLNRIRLFYCPSTTFEYTSSLNAITLTKRKERYESGRSHYVSAKKKAFFRTAEMRHGGRSGVAGKLHMAEAIEYRFGLVDEVPHRIQR
jgi:hypothetical protein